SEDAARGTRRARRVGALARAKERLELAQIEPSPFTRENARPQDASATVRVGDVPDAGRDLVGAERLAPVAVRLAEEVLARARAEDLDRATGRLQEHGAPLAPRRDEDPPGGRDLLLARDLDRVLETLGAADDLVAEV